jgi:hypothetical protein
MASVFTGELISARGFATARPITRLATTHSPPMPAFPDINECAIGGGGHCSPNADCFNNPGGKEGTFMCSCKDGYKDPSGKNDGSVCEGESGLRSCAGMWILSI